MAKVKLSLQPDPTFKSPVQIPIAGKSPAPVDFTFIYRGKSEMADFMEKNRTSEDIDVICGHELKDGESREPWQRGIASNWDLEDGFNRENVDKLLEAYPGAGQAVISRYYEEVLASRLGNSKR